jgi:rfaE bifunctional protein nucleotidyltransferase chain/domain
MNSKIRTIKDLGVLLALPCKEMLSPQKVVLCHGVFDLLHAGHIKHLKAAKQEGSILVVTVTSDRWVNKGPDRPVFTDHLRAEMLAELECVDWVAVSDFPNAMEAVDTIKPDVYVKGGEYRDTLLEGERKVTEHHGGRVHFTDEVTFSSSTLLNQHFNLYDPELKTYLDSLREQGALQKAIDALEKIKDMKVLVVGEVIIDEYHYVEPLGKSGKENLVATLFQRKEVFEGGSAAAAKHVGNFCKQVDVIGDVNGREIPHKVRTVDTSSSMRKLSEVYYMDDTPLSSNEQIELNDFISKHIDIYDVVIVTDFGHGLITPSTVELLQAKAKFLAVNTQTNGGNYGFNLISKYQRWADYACLDSREMRLAAHDKVSPIEDIDARDLIDCPNTIVTMGKDGCLVQGQQIPALTNTIVDTVGAGDAFFSVTAPLVAAGVPMKLVGFIGNAVGALKAGIVGHRSSVDKAALIKFMEALLK